MENKASTVKVPAIPVVIKKGSKISLLKNRYSAPNNDLKRCIKFTAVTKDQVIYKSVPGDFLRGEFPGLTLLNRSNVLNQTSCTVARFTDNDNGSGTVIEKTSNAVVKLIGQNNYDTVFSALCSVISQELRIRALLALLTIEGSKKKDVPAQTDRQTEKKFADTACQTDESCKFILDNFKQRKRVRRQQFRPYIVKEDHKELKRVVIDPKTLSPIPPQCNTPLIRVDKVSKLADEAIVTECKKEDINESFPELSGIVNEDSNFSDTSIGNISLTSQHSMNIPQLLENPTALLDNVDDHTDLNIVPLPLLDGSIIMVCEKPMDKFHWASPHNLKNLSDEDRIKLLYHQMIIHWKYCLEKDEDGYLPIHHAVMTNDLDFLNHQCAALMKKYGSVDIPAAGNMTALQMSISAEGTRGTAALLQAGADPCLPDDEGKSFFHTAAEVSHDHLEVALLHCRANARAMLKEDEDLWNPVMEEQTDDQLARILLDHICVMCDNQGYTPLMLASKQGNYASVQLLLQASPHTVNRPTPNSGSTALYVAVEAACVEAANSKNQTKISEKFLKTIEILMEGGGDPGVENHFGNSVNVLLTEFNIVDLSVLIANKMTAVRYFVGDTFAPSNINSLMLLKNSDGKVNVTDIRPKKGAETKVASPRPSDVKPTGNTEDKKVNKKVNSNDRKTSKVEIKEIKTIKPNISGESKRPKTDAQFAVPTSVEVKPSHFIIVPRKSQTSPDVPKYVKILPKLEPNIPTSSATVDVKKNKHKKLKMAPCLKEQMKDASQSKTDADCEATPVKKQRRETKSGQKVDKRQSFNKSSLLISEVQRTDIESEDPLKIETKE